MTALLKGRFAIEHEGEREVPAPDETSGLYIQDKNSGLYSKISYAPTSAAFQLGEAAQVLTGGRLEATPHYVQAPSAQKGSKDICRDTFALFMQVRFLLSGISTFTGSVLLVSSKRMLILYTGCN